MTLYLKYEKEWARYPRDQAFEPMLLSVRKRLTILAIDVAVFNMFKCINVVELVALCIEKHSRPQQQQQQKKQ